MRFLKENLERAKGLEPSTPTLARSCSTTELHPHPGWRRSLAGNARPMPNAHRECNRPKRVKSRDREAMDAESPEMRGKPLMFRQHGLLGTLAPHCPAQRFEPFRKPAAQRPG